MADRAVIFSTVVIQASQVPTDPIRCPYCQGRNLVLEGKLSYPHREVREGERLVSHETEKIDNPFVVEQFQCMLCSRNYIIKPDRECQLETELAGLQEEVSYLRGEASKLC